MRRSRARNGRRVAGALAAGVAGTVAVVALATAGGGGAPAAEGLPSVVNAPGTWSDHETVVGPVAALGIATRTRPVGLLDERQSLSLFAVSATDGSASWLRPPGFSLQRWGFGGGFAVSPDGRWIGWVRPAPERRGQQVLVEGWSVMSTTTGRVRELEDPGPGPVGGTLTDLEFSGDSRYLLTSYEAPDLPGESDGRGRSRDHQLVAWDVTDGSRTVLEEPGYSWLPVLGSAPTGVVWARGHEVLRVDPATDARTSVRVPRRVVGASWGPDGRSFAYLGRQPAGSSTPWRLYAGRSVAQARSRELDLPPDVEADELLGWRDATHVVVGHFRRTVHVVDVVSGDVEEIDLAGYGEQLNAPSLAEALWQRPLLDPAEPEGTTDPRRPWRWAGSAVLLAGIGVVLLRRRSRTDPPRPSG